jgi:hypothetical protein
MIGKRGNELAETMMLPWHAIRKSLPSGSLQARKPGVCEDSFHQKARAATNSA